MQPGTCFQAPDRKRQTVAGVEQTCPSPAARDVTARRPARPRATRLLDVKRIYHERGVERSSRGKQILGRFPDAELIEVASHSAIPGPYGTEGNVEDWVRNKRGARAR